MVFHYSAPQWCHQSSQLFHASFKFYGEGSESLWLAFSRTLPDGTCCPITQALKSKYANQYISGAADPEGDFQLDVDVSGLIFSHHPLFSREHVLGARLAQLYDRYLTRQHNNLTGHLADKVNWVVKLLQPRCGAFEDIYILVTNMYISYVLHVCCSWMDWEAHCGICLRSTADRTSLQPCSRGYLSTVWRSGELVGLWSIHNMLSLETCTLQHHDCVFLLIMTGTPGSCETASRRKTERYWRT